MMWRNAVLLFVAALLWIAGPGLAQSPPANTTQSAPPNKESKTKGEFFAGTVLALTSDQITVAREVSEASTEKRSFRIDNKTKIGSAVKVKSQVTVHYEHTKEGDVAIEIQVRPTMHTKKPS
ncbi:MAG: hypothetical protein ACRD3Y_11475 [Bryobacteraceae bacterium]